ncbi:MAG: PAS domain-containing protein [Rhodoferax sp.]|uniref:sensor histidine kinase n=1 Tax=Rhodoferax sp. TaxID=50421 RepID=UPI001B639193|nr:ATP-binding protein [Rhodoferax sp.]MBP9904068.1 PAS domain-containing protein [Rhodoferax sp.]
MRLHPVMPSWLTATASGGAPDGATQEFERLWLGFMTGRVALGLTFTLLHTGIYLMSSTPNRWPLLICLAYVMAALMVRVLAQPQRLSARIDGQWAPTVGVDVITFAALQIVQNSGINYTPLLALPVLMASVLGSELLALAAAAGVTLLLFAYAGWQSLLASTEGDNSTFFLQAALTGAACFAVSFIASQMASRLARVEQRAQHNQLAAEVQRQVNELVIESLADAVLVVDAQGQLRSANPAAQRLLGISRWMPDTELNLNAQPDWQALFRVIATCFGQRQAQQDDISIRYGNQGSRQLRVRTQLTPPQDRHAQQLCVVFLQDQREIQARIRSEKLASMGRMSAAVAHEIRNPLAAITQANALLSEELHDTAQLRLSGMVAQNAQRLEKIVHDVLNLAHVGSAQSQEYTQPLALCENMQRFCQDWKTQNRVGPELQVRLPADAIHVTFDPEHLRRVLFNLLDNARRYTQQAPDSIQVSVDVSDAYTSQRQVRLCVWSKGVALEPSVEQHLFEPFFSSESRSSGLGLYICRELCERHGASIAYDRSTRLAQGLASEGNAFILLLRASEIDPTDKGQVREAA